MGAPLPHRFGREEIAFVGHPGLDARVAADLADGGDALIVTAMGAAGSLPKESTALEDGLRSGLTVRPTWAHYAGLHQLGAIQPRDLGPANRLAGMDAERQGTLAAMVLTVAAHGESLDNALPELAAGLHSQSEAVIRWTLSALWAHTLDVPMRNIEEAVGVGCGFAGVPPIQLEGLSGGKAKRTRQAVLTLVDGVDHIAARLLAALYAKRSPENAGLGPVVTAAWLASSAFETSSAEAALLTGHDGDPRWMSRARRDTSAEEQKELAATLPELWLWCAGSSEESAQQAVAHNHSPPRLGSIGVMAHAHLPALLEHQALWPNIFHACAYVPTEQILSSLLRLPLPAADRSREAMARALAMQGDSSVLQALGELVAEQHPARRIAAALLGTA